MDWSRIKSILIFVFLFTNIILGYLVYDEYREVERDKTANVDRVLQLLETKNVSLIDDIEIDTNEMDLVFVTFETYDEDDLTLFLGETYYDNKGYYVTPEKGAKINNRQFIFYMLDYYQGGFLYSENPEEIKDEDVLKNIFLKANYFLAQYQYKTDDYIFESAYHSDIYDVLEVKQIYNEYPIEDTKMQFIFYKGEIVGFNRRWFVINDASISTKYDIISLDQALYTIYPLLNSGDIITNVELCLKLNDTSLVVNNLVEGEVSPFYKIETNYDRKSVNYVRAVDMK